MIKLVCDICKKDIPKRIDNITKAPYVIVLDVRVLHSYYRPTLCSDCIQWILKNGTVNGPK